MRSTWMEDLWCLCFESYRICTWNAAPPATAMIYPWLDFGTDIKCPALRIGLMKERVKVYALDTSLLLSLRLRATAHSFGGRKQIKIPSNIKFPDELIPKVHTECLEWTSFDWILNQTVTQLTTINSKMEFEPSGNASSRSLSLSFSFSLYCNAIMLKAVAKRSTTFLNPDLLFVGHIIPSFPTFLFGNYTNTL